MNLPEERSEKFRRNERLEMLLRELEVDLGPSESRLLPRYLQAHSMEFPLILIMGPLRSGTTLFTQWLANTGLVAYPSNLLSRFYYAPIIGAKIQLLLCDPRYNFRDELGNFSQQVEYVSHNGKTNGVLAPNEFWYFWRRFLAEPQRDVWTDDELRRSFDKRTMLAELAGVIDVFQKPFAAKAMLFNYNIPFLDSIIDKVLFVSLNREPVANVSSALAARERQFGSGESWYSFQIPERKDLEKLDPVSQVAGQVHYTRQAILRGLEEVDESRKMVVNYEDFCADPKSVFEKLTGKLSIKESKYEGPVSFKPTRAEEISNRVDIEKAIRRFN